MVEDAGATRGLRPFGERQLGEVRRSARRPRYNSLDCLILRPTRGVAVGDAHPTKKIEFFDMSQRLGSDSQVADRLKQQLLDAGFRVEHEERHRWSNFGNRLTRLDRGPLTIHIVRDRGEWGITIETPDGELRDVPLWHDFLAGLPPRVPPPMSFADEAVMLLSVVGEVAARASAPEPDFNATLERMDEYVEARTQLMHPGVVIERPNDRGRVPFRGPRYHDLSRRPTRERG